MCVCMHFDFYDCMGFFTPLYYRDIVMLPLFCLVNPIVIVKVVSFSQNIEWTAFKSNAADATSAVILFIEH